MTLSIKGLCTTRGIKTFSINGPQQKGLFTTLSIITLRKMTFSIMTLSMKGLSAKLSINDKHHK